MVADGYDPLSPDTLADPFPAYAGLRARCPVHHHADFQPPFFTLTRREDVLAGLRDWELWSIRYGSNPQYMRSTGLFTDPPEHTGFRKLFNRGFTPRTVGRLEDEIEALGRELLDAVIDDGSGDFHDFYASPLPITIISRLLGIPTDDLPLFEVMCNDLVATYNVPDPAAGAPARARLDAYFQGHIDERRATLAAAGVTQPGPEHLGAVVPNDLLSGFVVAEQDGRRLTDREMHLMLVLLLLGGLETSTALLGNIVWRLLEDRSRWEAVQADPDLIDVAVEESLRHDPPVLGLFRTPTRDVELHGVTIPEKAKVMLCFASANRDVAEGAGITDPETFRLDRPLDEVRQHLSFGFGVHYCPGAHLARLEAKVTLRLLLERMPDLRLAGPTERIVPFILWGRRHVPVAWS
ncbi:MAG: cytochrome P450 [Acidimicrobiales bacterium]|jgi:cytochrome P450|nr:cytochrome P450 [Acidimicrobiales bacterium]